MPELRVVEDVLPEPRVRGRVRGKVRVRVRARGRVRVRPLPPMDESSLGCHGARYVPYARGWYACPARTVRVALGANCPAPHVGSVRKRLLRVVRTYSRRPRGVRVSLGQHLLPWTCAQRAL